jgi:hypothetical protein
MQPKNPANPTPGTPKKLPGLPQDKNPAGTPDPKPDEFPGKPPSIYAQQNSGSPKNEPRTTPNPSAPKDTKPRDAARKVRPK